MTNKNSAKPIIWIRKETRPGEKRTHLIPVHAKALIKAGYSVYVEKSRERIYGNGDYEKAGCLLVEPGSWVKAPENSLIIGFKELPDEKYPLKHRHFYAGHCLDGEENSFQILKRFRDGGGTLYALETLLNSQKHQIIPSSAGYLAGVCGTAISLMVWDQKIRGKKPPFKIHKYFAGENRLKQYLKNLNTRGLTRNEECLLIAPHGQAGHGARSVLDYLGIKYATWARKETSDKKTLKNILNYKIVINCIMIDYLENKSRSPVFLTDRNFKSAKKFNLSIIADISCDCLHPLNPFPIYSRQTNFDEPTLRVKGIDIIAISNLPTMLAKQCSDMVSEDFFPLFCQYLMVGDHAEGTPWQYALIKFRTALKNAGL